MFGKTKAGKQRYQCLVCNKTFVWKKPYNKKYKEQHWFKLWITEGYSVRQLTDISGYSKAKIFRIINHWLTQSPNQLSSEIDLSQVKYLTFDGTYFHKTGCLIVLMDIETKKYIYYEYVKKENYFSVSNMCKTLKQKGLNPKAITVDGHPQVIRSFRENWPTILVQRCLFHIKMQGRMWLREYPKTEAGKALKVLLSALMNVHSYEQQIFWIKSYDMWHSQYNKEIISLAKTSIAAKDLKRTMSLINNALTDMFHFIKDQKIASTSNLLESYFSKLKHKYRCHNGLTETHKIAYLKWFCYYKNQAK